MEALSLISQLYMWILVILLFIGIGLGILSFVNYVTDKLEPKNALPVNKPVRKESEPKPDAGKIGVTSRAMELDVNWLRFTAFSFLGLLFVVTILGLFSMSKKPQITNQHSNHQNAVDPNNYSMMNGMPYTSNYDPYGTVTVNSDFMAGLPGQINAGADALGNHSHTYSSMSNMYQGGNMIPQSINGQSGSPMYGMQYYQW